MIIRIIGLVVVVVCGLAALFFKKLAGVILKRDITDDEALKFKMLMLLISSVGALAVILPDYI